MEHALPIRLGLRANWPQFALLALANAFVGGIVGAQRSILPLVGAEHFGLASATAVTSFVVSFGIVKAFTNLAAGALAGRFSRRRLLILGWISAIPIPFLLAHAGDERAWWIIVAANALLGLNQGLCWTMTIVMKVDLVGPPRRGLALGVNEAAGYTAVALAAFLAAALSTAAMPLRGVVLLSGLCAGAGLLLSLLFIRDTTAHARIVDSPVPAGADASLRAGRTARRPRAAAAQAGLICNLNDAVIWTSLAPFLAARQFDAKAVGLFAALYPAVWGLGQIFTGALSDRVGRRRLIIGGMLTQGAGHFALASSLIEARASAALGCALLGLGTALAYPSLLGYVADHSAPADRPRALGAYRFFRDMGYAVGALFAGVLADAAGYGTAIHVSGAVTVISGIIFAALSRRARS